MIVSIASLKAAGLTDEQIVAVANAAEREHELKVREQNRIRKRNQRARAAVTRDNVTDETTVTEESVTENEGHARHDVTRDSVTSTPPSASPSPMVSPNTPSLTPPPSPSPGETARAREARVVALARRGTRLADDWQPSDKDLKDAGHIGLRLYEIDAEILKFIDYWHAKAGANAVKIDWSATWRNWCRGFIEGKGKHGGGNGGRQLQDDRLSVSRAADRLMREPELTIPPRPSLVSAASEKDRRLLPKG